jgi:hypothetical protein
MITLLGKDSTTNTAASAQVAPNHHRWNADTVHHYGGYVVLSTGDGICSNNTLDCARRLPAVSGKTLLPSITPDMAD